MRTEERDRLALILLRLPARDREILEHFLRGSALEEIAGKIGITYDSARVGLQRAIQRARVLS